MSPMQLQHIKRKCQSPIPEALSKGLDLCTEREQFLHMDQMEEGDSSQYSIGPKIVVKLSKSISHFKPM